MGIENVETMNENTLNSYEKKCMKDIKNTDNLLQIVSLYGEATQTFGPSTNRDTFLEYIFSRCATIFGWDKGRLENIDQMKINLYQFLFAKAPPKDSSRAKGVIPAIASYTLPKHRADFDEKMSDLEMIEHRLGEEIRLLKSLAEDGPARQKALAKLAEEPNRRNTPEVTLQMRINAKKIKLKEMHEMYQAQEALVRASGITQGNFFVPERVNKNETVRTGKVFDDFLGQVGNDLEDLADLT